jgi:hypothetical protein
VYVYVTRVDTHAEWRVAVTYKADTCHWTYHRHGSREQLRDYCDA